MIDVFKNAIIGLLGRAPAQVVPDGTIHRFGTSEKAGDQAGYCALFDHGGGFLAGYFGCFRSGLYQTWHSKNGGKLNHSEQEKVLQAKQEAEAERERKAKETAEKAQYVWNNAKPAPKDHPYLVKKKIQPHGTRVDKHGNLSVPVIVDECHRTPSSMFTDAVRAFDCKYMFGLSATAYRRDGLDPLIYWTLGEKVHQVDPQELKQTGAVLTPEVIRRETSFRYQYQGDYPQMLSALTLDRARNEQIAHDVIRQAQSRPLRLFGQPGDGLGAADFRFRDVQLAGGKTVATLMIPLVRCVNLTHLLPHQLAPLRDHLRALQSGKLSSVDRILPKSHDPYHGLTFKKRTRGLSGRGFFQHLPDFR